MIDHEKFNKADFEASAVDAAKLMRVLSNERRLMVLCHLGSGELSVGEIQEHLGLSQSALSQHLAVLRSQNIVSTRREAQTVFYRISDPSAVKIITTLAEIFCP
jgi:DNA-binding transcriptional ArsR family regulator